MCIRDRDKLDFISRDAEAYQLLLDVGIDCLLYTSGFMVQIKDVGTALSTFFLG